MNTSRLRFKPMLIAGVSLLAVGVLVVIIVSGRGGVRTVSDAHKAGGPLPKASATVSAVDPMLVFDLVSHDFGTILEGSQARFRFPFRNIGGSDLLIGDVRFTCGCAGAATSTKRVLAGEEGYVETWFSSDPGPVGAKIYVEANDVTGVHQLNVSGIVEPRVALSTSIVNFGDIPPGGKTSRPFSISNLLSSSDSDLMSSLIQFAPSCKELKVNVAPPATPDSALTRPNVLDFELVLEAGAELGAKSAIVSINVPCADKVIRRRLDVTYAVVGAISVKPQSGFFSLVRGNGQTTAAVELLGVPDKPFQITDVTCDTDLVKVQIETIRTQMHYRIKAVVTEGYLRESVRGLVTVRTTDEHQGTIVLPVRFLVLARPLTDDSVD